MILMKTYFLLAASTAVAAGCVHAPAATVPPPLYDAADWAPPEEFQLALPERNAPAKPFEPAPVDRMNPNSVSRGERGALVNLPTKR
jgi:hypothetical protein